MMSVAPILERNYVRPELLVDTEWVAAHLQDPNVRIVESNEDPLLYPAGHIPGAVEVDWANDLNHPLRRDYLDRQAFEALCSRLGVTPDTKIIFYGDRNNWWACYALWVFSLFGHTNVAIMDGGRIKWLKEGRELTKDVPHYPETAYTAAQERDDQTDRAFRDEVLAHVKAGGQLIDVRSPDEFSGARTHMEGFPNEGALRAGHIPGAKSVPWARAVDPETGTFLPADQLRAIYNETCQLDPQNPTITYCRIGERSSHTWFALKFLLGYENVRNYDGSWTEWGNGVGLPIEKDV